MKSSIKHTGIVTKSTPGYLTVKISPEANECGGCAIASMCSKAEEITVPFNGDGNAMVGKQVTITVPSSAQNKAVLIFFVIPVCLLIVVLIAAFKSGCSETISGLIAIASVILWYIAVKVSKFFKVNKIGFKVCK